MLLCVKSYFLRRIGSKTALNLFFLSSPSSSLCSLQSDSPRLCTLVGKNHTSLMARKNCQCKIEAVRKVLVTWDGNSLNLPSGGGKKFAPPWSSRTTDLFVPASYPGSYNSKNDTFAIYRCHVSLKSTKHDTSLILQYLSALLFFPKF